MKNRIKLLILGLLVLGIWLMWPKPNNIKEEHQKFIQSKNKNLSK